MSNDSEKPICGASCLPGFANYIGQAVSQNGTIDCLAEQNNQYIVVHLYLVPGDIRQRRELREAIEAELAPLNAIKLHALAFAVPTSRGDEWQTAELVWERLMFVGNTDRVDARVTRPEDEPDAWQTGDVIYVHYMGAEGIGVLAAAPKTGQRLPHAKRV